MKYLSIILYITTPLTLMLVRNFQDVPLKFSSWPYNRSIKPSANGCETHVACICWKFWPKTCFLSEKA